MLITVVPTYPQVICSKTLCMPETVNSSDSKSTFAPLLEMRRQLLHQPMQPGQYFFLFFSPNLFLSMCNHALLAGNGLVSHMSGDPMLNSYRLTIFWHNMLLPIRAHFLLISFIHKFNDFSILTKHLPHTVALTFAV